jgi:hypothetical protein
MKLRGVLLSGLYFFSALAQKQRVPVDSADKH